MKLTNENFIEILDPIIPKMSTEALDVYHGLLEFVNMRGLENIGNKFAPSFEELEKWAQINIVENKPEDKPQLQDIDYQEKYNLTGINIEEKIRIIKDIHKRIGTPAKKENIKGIRQFCLSYSGIISYSSVYNLLINVINIDNFETLNA